jgi:hypothetical protein
VADRPLEGGVISHLNEAARGLGLAVGLPLREAMHYFAPVGEKELYVERAKAHVGLSLAPRA